MSSDYYFLKEIILTRKICYYLYRKNKNDKQALHIEDVYTIYIQNLYDFTSGHLTNDKCIIEIINNIQQCKGMKTSCFINFAVSRLLLNYFFLKGMLFSTGSSIKLLKVGFKVRHSAFLISLRSSNQQLGHYSYFFQPDFSTF